MASYKITKAHRKFLAEIGRKGGISRAQRLTPEERQAISSKAGSSPKKVKNAKRQLIPASAGPANICAGVCD